MKTKTWILLIAAIAAVCLGLSIFLLLPGGDAVYAEISSGEKTLDKWRMVVYTKQAFS